MIDLGNKMSKPMGTNKRFYIMHYCTRVTHGRDINIAYQAFSAWEAEVHTRSRFTQPVYIENNQYVEKPGNVT